MRAIWSARLSLTLGHLGEDDLLLALHVGVVDVQVQAAPLQRLADSSRVLFDVRNTSGICLAMIVPSSGIDDLVLGEDLEQQRLGLDLDAVDLVDQQHDRIVGA